MNKIRLIGMILLVVSCLSTAVWAQTSIVNPQTEQHQMIAGSKVSVILGAGFVAAESFTGLQNPDSQSTIMVLETSTPYAQYIEQAIPLVINNARSTMTERSRYTINGMPARLYVGTQKGDTDSLNFHRIFLVFGNEKETIALNCHYPDQPESADDNAIMETILSVRYHPDVAVDPMQNMGFKISTAGTSFVFTRKTGTALQYTQQQKNNWSPGAFFVDRKNTPSAVSDKEDFMLRQVAPLFDVDSVLFARDLSAPQQLPAYEVMANLKSRKTGDIVQAYFITLFDENRAYSFIGYHINEIGIEEMKTILRSLEIL